MEQRGLDAILITNRTNHRYFSGFYAEVFALNHYYYFAVLLRDKRLEPVFLCSHGNDRIATTTWIRDRRLWDFPRNFYMSKESPGIGLLAEVIREMELSNDMHPHMGAEHLSRLRELTPAVGWNDASDVIMEVRAVKSSAENDKLRRAPSISAEAVRFGFESLAAGMTEVELKRIIGGKMYQLGATDIGLITNYAGPRRMWSDATPAHYQIQKGDLVQFDGGCLVDGYWCDFKRMCSVGKPSDEDQRYYDIAREGIEVSTALLKAGVGLDIHERPGLAFHNHVPLEANMVLSIEPFITLDGVFPFWEARGKFGLEASVLITDDGHEILTAESIISHDLMVV